MKQNLKNKSAQAAVQTRSAMRAKVALLSLVLLVGIVLLGCTNKDDLLAFDGQFYKAKLSKIDKQRDQFTIAVSPVSASLVGAREAGRYEATKHCIKNYGTSDVAWASGPDAEDGGLRVEGDTLHLQGACIS